MWILPKSTSNGEDGIIEYALKAALDLSRFKANVEKDSIRSWGGHRHGVKVTHIRLRNRKDYCGQHPGPCQLNGKKHMRSNYLEGADWVGFNDGLNRCLDGLKMAADVFSYNREAFSNRYYIRRGHARRINYDCRYVDRGGRIFVGWLEGELSVFEDYCGKDAPVSSIEPGTPGLLCWTLEEERLLNAAQETTHA